MSRHGSRGGVRSTTPHRVEIIDEHEVFDRSIFTIREARLRFERYDGTMSREVVRLNLDRGDSVAALVHDTADDCFVFTEQFRYPAYSNRGPGWMIEIPAGMVDERESADEAARREIREEVGYGAVSLQPIGAFYVSPGGSSERVQLYYAVVDGGGRTAPGGGLAHEEEDIRVVRLTPQQSLEELEQGAVVDAKTIIALQWFKGDRSIF